MTHGTTAGTRPVLEVRDPGPLTLVQDLGRPGHARIGVGRSGAADRGALRLANRVVANPEGTAALEVVLGGLEVVVHDAPAWICVTGAPATLRIGSGDLTRTEPAYALVHVPVGGSLRLEPPTTGLRSYVAVRGGLDVDPLLGSRGHDVLAGLGPPPVRAGDRIAVGSPPAERPVVDQVAPPDLSGDLVLRVVRGPRDSWVRDADALVDTEWTVSDRSNRIGVRLDASDDVDGLLHRRTDELPSEGVWRGAVQVPPSGGPVLLLADHPVTGGYPVVGVVVDADVDRAAQARPGDRVRLRWTAHR